MPDESQALDDVDVFETKTHTDFDDEWAWEMEERLRIKNLKREFVFWSWIAILFSISGGLFLARFVG